jgi:hypothetical protein
VEIAGLSLETPGKPGGAIDAGIIVDLTRTGPDGAGRPWKELQDYSPHFEGFFGKA